MFLWMVKMMNLNGRRVVDVEIDGVDSNDSPDFCDAFFCSAVFLDTGDDLTAEQLNELGEKYPSVLNEMAMESLI